MIKAKDRKNKLISKKKMLAMVNLFEKKVDATIKLVDVSNRIIGTVEDKLYRIDLSKNTVEPIYREWYKYETYDFD